METINTNQLIDQDLFLKYIELTKKYINLKKQLEDKNNTSIKYKII